MSGSRPASGASRVPTGEFVTASKAGRELVTWWEEIDGIRYKGETLIVWHRNRQRWIHMGCDRPKCPTCNSHGFGSYPT